MSTGNQLGDDFFDIPLVPQYKELNVDNDDAESEQFFRETNGARVPRLEKENLTPLALAGAMRELKIEPAEAVALQQVASSAVEGSTSVTQAAVDSQNTEELTESIPKLAMFGYQKKPQRRSYEQRKQEMEAEKEKEVHKAAPRVPSRSRYAVTREDAPVLRPRHRSTSLADRQRQQSVERAPATQTRGRSPGPAVRPLPASSGPNTDRQRSVSRNSQERMSQTSYRARAGSVERATGPSVPSVRSQNVIRSRTPSISASTRAPLTGSRPQSPAGPTLGSRPQSQEPRPVRPPSPSLGAHPTQITRHRSPSVGNRPASPAMGTRSLTSSSQANATQGPARVSGVRVPAAKPTVRTATSRGTVSTANGIATTVAAGAGASLRNKTRTTGPLRAPPRPAVPVAKPGPIRVPSKDNNLRATPRAPTSAARRAAAPTSAARRAAAPTSAARSAANTPRARHFGGSEVRRPVVPRSSVIHGVTPQKTDVFKVGLRRYPVASGTTPMRPLSDPNDGIEPSNAEHRIAMRRERSDATIGEERPNSQASGTSDGGRSRARAAGGATPKPNVADVVNRLYQPRRPTGATPARSTARPVATGRTPTVTLPSSRRVMQTPKGMFGALKQKVNVKPRAPEASAASEVPSQAEAPSSTVSSNVGVPDCQ